MGIDEVVIAYHSPWQSPYVERLIGSIRRECLDHVIVLDGANPMHILTSYFAYYSEARSQLSLDRKHRFLVRTSHRVRAASSPSRTSAACITATPARPDTARFFDLSYQPGELGLQQDCHDRS